MHQDEASGSPAAGAEPQPPTVAEPRRDASPDELARGAALGRYLVLERLGAGGMGVVYAAFDPELDRKVAIKLLHAGGSSGGHARLLREAQAMARLAHPNVIAVHDVGTFGDEVFVAMELIVGPTLAELIGEGRPHWRRVLELYRQAGLGLAAAHAAGIVHRDFKPNNVLVGPDDRVRVLDFGLARGIGAPSDQPAVADPPSGEGASRGLLSTPLTGTGSFLGTPGYMAPEQLAGSPADATSDQFSFCVALYEGLYGERPFTGGSLSDLVLAVSSGAIRPEPAGNPVPRWLRAVVLRGLSVRPEDRYASMVALLAALADDPGLARRRRLRWAAAAAAVGLATAALVGFQRRQGQLCSGAEQRLAGAWDEGRRAAVRRAVLATGLPYADDAWASVERALGRYAGAWVAMRTDACAATRLRGEQSEELLDLRMACLDRRREELAALSAVLAQADAGVVKTAVSAAYALTPLDGCADATALRAVGGPPADPLLRRRAAELRRDVSQARALNQAGRYEEALRSAQRAAAASRRLGYRPLEAETQFELGSALAMLARHAEAARSFEEALLAANAAGDDALAMEAATQLVRVIGYREARYEEGERWGRHARAFLERHGPDDRLAGILHNHLGTLYTGKGDFERALAEQRLALRLREQALGPEHPDTGRSLNNLAAALIQAGRDAEAVPHLERSLRIKEQTLGREHPDLASTLINLGVSLSNLDRLDEAITHARRALELDRRYKGPDHPSVALSLGNIAAYYEQLGQPQQAIAHAREALAISERAHGPDHPEVAFKLSTLGNALLAAGETTAAERAYRRSLAIREAHYERSHPEIAFPLTGLGRSLLAANRAAEATPLLRRAVAIRDRPDIGGALLAESRFHLARALWESGARSAATALARQARQELRADTNSRLPQLEREMDRWLGEHDAPG